MNIVLFGATGYLGSHIAEQFINRGHQVHCLVRPGSDSGFLNSINATIITVDFSNLKDHSDLIDAQTTVVNCISDTRPHASYKQRGVVEIDLTRQLFELTQAQNAKRFIQLSTVMVYGFDRPDTPIDEEYPLKPKYIYNRIAADREKTLLNYAAKGGTELVIVRPSNTLGKRDKSLLPNFVKSHRQGMFPSVGDGKWSFSCIDARDVGRAFEHLLTVSVAKPEIYLVKGYDLDWPSFKTQLDDFIGKPSKAFNLPKALIMVVGRILEAVYPFGSTPPLTRFDMEVMSCNTLFDDSKIRATGFSPQYQLIDGFKDGIKKRR